jgi:hypothetical protein
LIETVTSPEKLRQAKERYPFVRRRKPLAMARVLVACLSILSKTLNLNDARIMIKALIRVLFVIIEKYYERRLGSSYWNGDSRAARDGNEDFLRVCGEFWG